MNVIYYEIIKRDKNTLASSHKLAFVSSANSKQLLTRAFWFPTSIPTRFNFFTLFTARTACS